MKKLLDYLPPFFADIAEFKAIFESVQAELALLQHDIETAVADLHVSTASEIGLRRLAESLHSEQVYCDPEDLRFALRTALLDRRPYTIRMLRNTLDMLCGEGRYILSQDIQNGVLTVRLNLSNQDRMQVVRLFLDRTVPANMRIDLDLLYHTHAMYRTKCHGSLTGYTHEQLRSDASIKENIQ